MDQRHQPATVAGTEWPVGRSVLIDQACGLLGVSKRTVYYWIRAGRLQTVRTLGGSQRILLVSIQALVEARATARRAAGEPVFAPDHSLCDRTSWRASCPVACSRSEC